MKTVSAVGFDLVRGDKTLELIQSFGFPSNKYLFAGVVDGRNIWANDLAASLKTLKALESIVGKGIHVYRVSQCLMLISTITRRMTGPQTVSEIIATIKHMGSSAQE